MTLLDWLFVVGLVLVVAGVSLIFIPAGLIVAGACLAGYALRAEEATDDDSGTSA